MELPGLTNTDRSGHAPVDLSSPKAEADQQMLPPPPVNSSRHPKAAHSSSSQRGRQDQSGSPAAPQPPQTQTQSKSQSHHKRKTGNAVTTTSSSSTSSSSSSNGDGGRDSLDTFAGGSGGGGGGGGGFVMELDQYGIAKHDFGTAGGSVRGVAGDDDGLIQASQPDPLDALDGSGGPNGEGGLMVPRGGRGDYDPDLLDMMAGGTGSKELVAASPAHNELMRGSGRQELENSKSQAATVAARERLTQLEKEQYHQSKLIETTRARIRGLKRSLHEAGSRLARLQEKTEDQRQQLNQIVGDVKFWSNKRSAAASSQESIRDEIRAIAQQIDNMKLQLSDLHRSAYEESQAKIDALQREAQFAGGEWLNNSLRQARVRLARLRKQKTQYLHQIESLSKKCPEGLSDDRQELTEELEELEAQIQEYRQTPLTFSHEHLQPVREEMNRVMKETRKRYAKTKALCQHCMGSMDKSVHKLEAANETGNAHITEAMRTWNRIVLAQQVDSGTTSEDSAGASPDLQPAEDPPEAELEEMDVDMGMGVGMEDDNPEDATGGSSQASSAASWEGAESQGPTARQQREPQQEQSPDIAICRMTGVGAGEEEQEAAEEAEGEEQDEEDDTEDTAMKTDSAEDSPGSPELSAGLRARRGSQPPRRGKRSSDSSPDLQAANEIEAQAREMHRRMLRDIRGEQAQDAQLSEELAMLIEAEGPPTMELGKAAAPGGRPKAAGGVAAVPGRGSMRPEEPPYNGRVQEGDSDAAPDADQNTPKRRVKRVEEVSSVHRQAMQQSPQSQQQHASPQLDVVDAQGSESGSNADQDDQDAPTKQSRANANGEAATNARKSKTAKRGRYALRRSSRR